MLLSNIFFLQLILNYSKHLYNNVRYSYKEVVTKKFWRCAYAKTEFVFNKVFAKIKKLNKKTAEYILGFRKNNGFFMQLYPLDMVTSH